MTTLRPAPRACPCQRSQAPDRGGRQHPPGHQCDRGLQPYPTRRATSPDTATPEPLNKVKGGWLCPTNISCLREPTGEHYCGTCTNEGWLSTIRADPDQASHRTMSSPDAGSAITMPRGPAEAADERSRSSRASGPLRGRRSRDPLDQRVWTAMRRQLRPMRRPPLRIVEGRVHRMQLNFTAGRLRS